MAAYKFKLQKLLDYKIKIEEDKKNKLGSALKRLENEKRRMIKLKKEFNEMEDLYRQKTSQGMSVNELKILANYIDYYKRGIKEQKVRIKMAEEYVTVCREELINATREKEMIEKLREKDYSKYLYEEQKKEEKLIDDLVSFKGSNKS
ncbi:MAG: flagellar export protein FliJ [Clostridiaceae bacterium]|nr:flagellar export protein FliJ [Clostridiaceae bacterium]